MKKLKTLSAKGFTLIELMIVVAIIGILAAIAIPKFADLVSKSREANVKGSLGGIRSALSIYYSDNEGVFPDTASLGNALTSNARYLQVLPSIRVPSGAHTNTNTVVNAATETGGWYYSGSAAGLLSVDCTHVDSKGSTWSTY